MKERRWSNIALVIFGFFVCLSLWQVIDSPAPAITVLHQYDIIPVHTLNSANSSSFAYPLHFLSPSDYEQLITIKDFRYTILNNVCNSSSPFLLILVHSAPINADKRQTIRETWGHQQKGIKVVFLIGNVDDEEDQVQLEKENEQHRDLIQGNFQDAYRNMTYKHVMALKYAIYHCPKAKYILKTDDDIFMNTPNVLAFLKEELSPYGAENLLLCALFPKPTRVKRSYRSKWRVSFSEYPYKYYPPYCGGWVVMYSPDVLFTLYREAQNAQYFWIDDVLITGLLAQKAKIAHTNIQTDPLILNEDYVREIETTSTCQHCSRSFLFAEPNLSQKQIVSLWRFVQQNNANVSIGASR